MINPQQTTGKPALLIDVDGVISLFGFDLDIRPPGRFVTVDGFPHFISASAGEHLLALAQAFELVWCSGWEEKANEYLPALLGLPGPLPHLRFDRATGEDAETTPGHWKLAAIDAYAGTRALAWVDDAFNEDCYRWASDRAQPTLLVATEPAIGLTGGQVAELLAWGERIGGAE